MAPTLADAFGLVLRQPHPQFDAVVEIDDVKRTDIFRRLHDAFADAESDGEILQVPRRSHHDGIGAPIIGQRDRGFLRDQPRALAAITIAPDLTTDDADSVVHRSYSAASAGAAIRREWRGRAAQGVFP